MQIERRRHRWVLGLAMGFATLFVGPTGEGRADGPAPGAAPAAPAPAPVPPSVPERPALLSLDRAATMGALTVRGLRPLAYEQVDLVLANRTDAPLRLDLAGRHLEPTTGGCQRLGLSHPVTPGDRPPDAAAGTWPIELSPHEERTVRMHTCCLDAGRPCPRSADRFQLADATTPPGVEQSLRWWTDHRSAEQGFVNHAIWAHDVRLLDRPYETKASDGTTTPVGPKGRRIRAYGGVAYMLVDGVLTSVDADGVRRFHGTEIEDVIPRADALYGIGTSAGGHELWRFAATGEPPWGRVFPVDGESLLDLVPIAGGAFVTRSSPSVVGWRASKDALPNALPIAADAMRVSVGPAEGARESKGRLVLVVHQKGTPESESLATGALAGSAPKFAVYDLDGRSGKAEIRKIFWNARDMVAGPGGVFSLSPVGTPEKLEGERLRRLATSEAYASIVLVGTEHLVLATKDRALVAFDVKTGRATPLPASAAAASSDLSFDPVTDDLVWVGEHDFLRWRIGAPEPEVIP